METLKSKYHQQLTLKKRNKNFYIIDFSNKSIGYTLLSDTTLTGIQNKWNELLSIINELVEMDINCSKEEIKAKLERIHGTLNIDFDCLYNIRKEFL